MVILQHNKRGFTLVELSIVLVIIGLLIGGILVAQSMIGTAKIQAQVRQFQQFDIAVSNFKTKFNQIPGDCNICNQANGTIAGNNDSKIGYGTDVPPTLAAGDPYFFFIDLSTMKMLTDTYKWVGVPYASSEWRLGKGNQFPKADIGRGGLIVSGNNYGDIFYTFNIADSTSNLAYWNQILGSGNVSPAEALALDTKLDDSLPVTGSVQSTSNTEAGSSSVIPFTADGSTCVSSGKYNLSLSATNLCRLVIKSNFN